MKKIPGFLLKILKIVLGIFLSYLAVCLFVFLICATSNIGSKSNSWIHEDAWITTGYQPAEWTRISPTKDWNTPAIWAQK